MSNLILSIGGGVLIAVGVLFLVMMTGGFFHDAADEKKDDDRGTMPLHGDDGEG